MKYGTQVKARTRTALLLKELSELLLRHTLCQIRDVQCPVSSHQRHVRLTPLPPLAVSLPLPHGAQTGARCVEGRVLIT